MSPAEEGLVMRVRVAVDAYWQHERAVSSEVFMTSGVRVKKDETLVDGGISDNAEPFLRFLHGLLRDQPAVQLGELQALLKSEEAPPTWLEDMPLFIPKYWRARRELEEIYGDYVELTGKGRGSFRIWSVVAIRMLLLAASGAWGLIRDLIPGTGRG
jgi:hypothetical protein